MGLMVLLLEPPKSKTLDPEVSMNTHRPIANGEGIANEVSVWVFVELFAFIRREERRRQTITARLLVESEEKARSEDLEEKGKERKRGVNVRRRWTRGRGRVKVSVRGRERGRQRVRVRGKGEATVSEVRRL